MKIESCIKQYLNDPEVFKELDLVEGGAIKLHWSNWDKLLSTLQDKVESGDEVRSQEDIKQRLEDYKRTPIWIINKSGNIESNLYDLYNFYLDPRMKELWFEINDETLISLRGAAGPYLRLQSMRWFDCDIYKVFIFNKLLSTNKIKRRSFRLSVNIPLECSFEDSVHEGISGRIVQLSKDGALIKFDNNSDIGKLETKRDIVFEVNFTPFKKAKNKAVEEMENIFTDKAFSRKGKSVTRFRLRENIVSLGNNKANYSFTGDSEAYMFFAFNDILDVSHNNVKKSIIEVVSSFEQYADKLIAA